MWKTPSTARPCGGDIFFFLCEGLDSTDGKIEKRNRCVTNERTIIRGCSWSVDSQCAEEFFSSRHWHRRRCCRGRKKTRHNQKRNRFHVSRTHLLFQNNNHYFLPCPWMNERQTEREWMSFEKLCVLLSRLFTLQKDQRFQRLSKAWTSRARTENCFCHLPAVFSAVRRVD